MCYSNLPAQGPNAQDYEHATAQAIAYDVDRSECSCQYGDLGRLQLVTSVMAALDVMDDPRRHRGDDALPIEELQRSIRRADRVRALALRVIADVFRPDFPEVSANTHAVLEDVFFRGGLDLEDDPRFTEVRGGCDLPKVNGDYLTEYVLGSRSA